MFVREEGLTFNQLSQYSVLARVRKPTQHDWIALKQLMLYLHCMQDDIRQIDTYQDIYNDVRNNPHTLAENVEPRRWWKG